MAMKIKPRREVRNHLQIVISIPVEYDSLKEELAFLAELEDRRLSQYCLRVLVKDVARAKKSGVIPTL